MRFNPCLNAKSGQFSHPYYQCDVALPHPLVRRTLAHTTIRLPLERAVAGQSGVACNAALPTSTHGRGPQAPVPPPRRWRVGGRMARPCEVVTSKRYKNTLRSGKDYHSSTSAFSLPKRRAPTACVLASQDRPAHTWPEYVPGSGRQNHVLPAARLPAEKCEHC